MAERGWWWGAALGGIPELPDELVRCDPSVEMGLWCQQGDWILCRE